MRLNILPLSTLGVVLAAIGKGCDGVDKFSKSQVEINVDSLRKLDNLVRDFKSIQQMDDGSFKLLDITEILREKGFAPGMVSTITNKTKLVHGGGPEATNGGLKWYANTAYISLEVMESYFENVSYLESFALEEDVAKVYVYSDRPWDNISEGNANLRLVNFMNSGIGPDLPIEPVLNTSTPEEGFSQDDRIAALFCGQTGSLSFGDGYLRPNMQIDDSDKKKKDQPWEFVFCRPQNQLELLSSREFHSIQEIRDFEETVPLKNVSQVYVVPSLATAVFGDVYASAVQQSNEDIDFQIAEELLKNCSHKPIFDMFLGALKELTTPTANFKISNAWFQANAQSLLKSCTDGFEAPFESEN